MFSEEEITIIKELIQIEIEEVEKLLKNAIDFDKPCLENHLIILKQISNKL